MTTKSIFRTMVILAIVFTNIGCDQVSKKIVRGNIAPNEIISMVGAHLVVTNVENTGAFLSLGDSLPKSAKNILLSILPLTALMLAFVYILIKHTVSNTVLAGLCFIIGGGLGNIFDRIVYGSVTDFLHIRFWGMQTGIFNMADVSVTTGVSIILLHTLFKRKYTSNTTG